MWLFIVFTVVVAAFLYKFLNSNKDFWRNYGVEEVDTSQFTSTLDMILGRTTQADFDNFVYEKAGSRKFVGVYEMGKPKILLKDLNLMKKVLIKDFSYFSDRAEVLNEVDGVSHKILSNLNGDEWKGVRSSVSPTFTTGKIRRMNGIFNEVGKEWVAALKEKCGGGSVKIPVTRSATQYTVDAIGSAAFGINAGAIRNAESIFPTMANRFASFTKIQLMKVAFRMGFPYLGKILGLTMVDMEAMGFFENILAQGLKERMSGSVKRNDFLQLMVEAMQGKLKAEGSDELSEFEKDAQVTGVKGKSYLTDEIIHAQCLLFFLAGFSTTSNAITYAAHCLAVNQDVQRKLREEVSGIVKEDGSIDYDDLGRMVYLDMVISEVLRKYPGFPRLERLCVRDYKDEETGLVVPKGAVVTVPIPAIQHDRKYYDNPDKFDPEHFSPEKKATRNSLAFIAFGSGPRNCIGMRFALINTKAAIAHLVHSFLIEPTEKTPDTPKAIYTGIGLVAPDDLELKLTPI